MADLEAERLQNMQANAQLLASLGLKGSASSAKGYSESKTEEKPNDGYKPKPQKRKRDKPPAPVEGARKSARIREQPAGPVDASVIEADDDPQAVRLRGPLIRKLEPVALPEPIDLGDYDPDYRAPLPTRDAQGTWRFEEGYEHFTPNLAPKEIFQKGVFGGGFWRETWSNALRKPLSSSDKDAFPADWWEGIDSDRLLAAEEYENEKNCYGVKAGQSLSEWEAAGWIRHWDPRGWMQWYCNFFLGRRTPDDQRQIKRWLGVCGATGRFKNSLLKKIAQAGGASAVHDREVAPVLRQTLLHWACEVTDADWERVAL